MYRGDLLTLSPATPAVLRQLRRRVTPAAPREADLLSARDHVMPASRSMGAIADREGFRFNSYTVDELREAGQRFVAALEARSSALVRTENWTDFALRWFAGAAAPGATVDSTRKIGARGEWLLDLTHSTYPEYGRFTYGSREYWRAATEAPCELLLGLESEWGKETNRPATLSMVLEDASKLAVVRARLKVMIYASCCGVGEDARDLEELLARLRRRTSDVAPWLCVDVPWGSHDLRHYVLV